MNIVKEIKNGIIDELEKAGEKKLADFLRSERKKLFFGQGGQAFICYDICHRLGISVEAFLGSNESRRYPVLPQDIPFYCVKDFDAVKDEYDVLLALNEKHNKDVIILLQENGFEHIYYSDCWQETNKVYRESFLNLYLDRRIGKEYNKTNELISYNDFKIYNYCNQDKAYASMLVGDFFDIIAPSVFEDNGYIREGGYENEVVKVEKDDIILDLGANIGMFSCVAAAKGKHVYAFEPTPQTVSYLEKNASLYDNFTIAEYAVSDNEGECEFCINSMNTDDVNTGANTMMKERMNGKDDIEVIKVKMITIDTFVEENQLESVDFIKADIEGAERYMLEGAKETLRKYAPKLSLCTYHLPDDPEVMEALILKYNPDYIIEQTKKKLYAYVPKSKGDNDTVMKVSVIVPAYNVENYIERCIESVLKQTFTDWEMLLVDDGSVDATADICKKYADADERIRYLYQNNQGQGIARNHGVEKASGKYIFFLDSDDWIREDTLQQLYEYAEAEQLDIVYFDHITMERNAQGKLTERYSKLPIQIQGVTNCLETPELLCRLEGAVWDKFYKKTLLADIQQKGHPYEDSAILPGILVKAGRIGQLKEALYYYWSVREDSTVNKSDTVFYLKDAIQEVYDSLSSDKNWMCYEDALRKYSEWMILVAKNHIARQSADGEKKLRYDKFIEECWELTDKLYPNSKQMRSYQFLVWGSYNLRSMVNRTQRNLRVPKYYYGFSNITSLMQRRGGNPILREVHANGYRERMIQMDVEQTFRHLSDKEYKETDFVCIDLLEERFLPIYNNGELITGSDALEEVTSKQEGDISYLGSKEWKKYALEYIAFLKQHFNPEQIILVENYMCTAHGEYGAEESFGEEYGDIAGLNERLKECYQYFEKQYVGIHIVSNMRKELEYTDNGYPHGCVPWHQNEYLYYEMAEKIEQIILDYTENR